MAQDTQTTDGDIFDQLEVDGLITRKGRRGIMFCSLAILVSGIALAWINRWSAAMLQPLVTAVLAGCIFVIAYRSKVSG